jgi:hypothetical protein
MLLDGASSIRLFITAFDTVKEEEKSNEKEMFDDRNHSLVRWNQCRFCDGTRY